MDRSSEGHTYQRYDGELNHLHYLVLEMGGLVLYQVRAALTALKAHDIALAQKVLARDREIDRLESKADGEISTVIARRAPVANDLRLVMAVSKSVSELERIGDEAVKIASLVSLASADETSDSRSRLACDVQRLGAMALTTLENAVEVFDVWSDPKARRVIENYRDMEKAFESILRRLMTRGLDDSRHLRSAVSLVLVIKALERIGHHAQNLAKCVILQVKGEYPRQQPP